MSLFTTDSTRARVLTSVLLATALAACGGGGSSSGSGGGGQVPFLAIDEDNAEQILYIALQGALGAPVILSTVTSIGFLDPADCVSGQLDITPGGDTLPERAEAQSCEINLDSSSLVVDGALDYDYDSHIEVETSSFRMISTSGDEQIDVVMRGEFDYDAEVQPVEKDFISDGDVRINAELARDGKKLSMTFQIDSLASTTFWNADNQYSLDLTSMLLLDGGSYRVSIETQAPLIQDDGDEVCYSDGRLNLRGANNSYITFLASGRDNISVDINGATAKYSCAEFEAYMETIEENFKVED
ncbi:hypothetical protein [Alloalcanivorax xenomutans]|uniref:hypothetical protein n=1 Tax=Alloalcanivorax xenomutans TaxID=1094342 RepID=UPI0007A7457F|nr:hypothetical protein [Alloalcanivorax xenomutans]ARB44795.1 hypothetical protein P40_04620 [Alloalcanivorax xenomutans]KYZ86654.1 hypothetical protein A3Q32_15255 [Alcanivorax sp. KX64203]